MEKPAPPSRPPESKDESDKKDIIVAKRAAEQRARNLPVYRYFYD